MPFTRTKHFVVLDGMRGVAAFAVVALHMLDPLEFHYVPVHAPLAVDFFFALSGFVIAHAYESRLQNELTFLEFAKIRLIRLYPLMFAGLFLGFVVLSIRAWVGHDIDFIFRGLAALVAGLLILPSPFLIRPGNEAAYPFNTPTWSLFDELVVNAAYALTVSKLSNAVLATIIILCASVLIVMSSTPGGLEGAENWSTLYRGLGKVFFSFGAGVALSRLHAAGRLRDFTLPALLPISLLAIILFTPKTPFPTFYYLCSVLLIFPLLIAVGANARLSGALERFAILAGQLSYPVYIVHYPFVRIFSNFARTNGYEHSPALLAVEATTIVLFSYAASVFVDQPIRQALGRASKRQSLSKHAT